MEHAASRDPAELHAAAAAYVPLHGACGPHARLAEAHGNAVLDPSEVVAFAAATLRNAAAIAAAMPRVTLGLSTYNRTALPARRRSRAA